MTDYTTQEDRGGRILVFAPDGSEAGHCVEAEPWEARGDKFLGYVNSGKEGWIVSGSLDHCAQVIVKDWQQGGLAA